MADQTASYDANRNSTLLAVQSDGTITKLSCDANGKLETTASVSTSAGTAESGTDATGQDAYATVLTPSENKTHIAIQNEGTNPVTISLDAGVTDSFIRIAGGSAHAFDSISVTTAAIQAKNASAGNNYTNLTIIVW